MSYYEKRIADLEARVAQLAREQRLKAIPVEAKLLERYALMQADNARLKAEVERLRASSFVTAVPVEQYERVIKAGDAMVEAFDLKYPVAGKVIKAWNEAKEGKQS